MAAVLKTWSGVSLPPSAIRLCKYYSQLNHLLSMLQVKRETGFVYSPVPIVTPQGTGSLWNVILLTLAGWESEAHVTQWGPGTYIVSYCWLQNFQYSLILFCSYVWQLIAVVIISCVWKRDESIHGWKQVGFNLLLSHPVSGTDHFQKKKNTKKKKPTRLKLIFVMKKKKKTSFIIIRWAIPSVYNSNIITRRKCRLEIKKSLWILY